MINKQFINEAIATQRLQQYEEEHDLLQYRLDGWCVWPIIRFGVARAIQNVPLDKTRPYFNKKKLCAIVLEDLWGIMKLHHADYVVKTLSSARADIKDGLFEDVHFDQFLKTSSSFIKIESINNPLLFPRRREAVIQTNFTTTLPSILASRLAKIDCRESIQSLAQSISGEIENILGVNKFSPDVIAESLYNFYWLKKVYNYIFKRINPKYLLTANPGEYPLIAAAKEINVKVIELQHGFLSRYYPAYSWATYAKPFKSNMPIPDLIFLYGEYWLEEMKSNGFWNEELRAVGSVRLDQFVTKEQKIKDDTCTILLTTQGTDTSRLILFIADFLQLAKGKLKLNLYIKLHPNYDTSIDLYEAKFSSDKRVHIVSSTSPLTTFELMKMANLHCSIFSTCHYEALGLGIPTIVLPLAGYETVSDLFRGGFAYLAHSPRDMVEHVMKWKNLSVSSDVRERFFCPNALANIKKELAIKKIP